MINLKKNQQSFEGSTTKIDGHGHELRTRCLYFHVTGTDIDAENLKIVAGLGHSQDLENQMLVMRYWRNE